MNQTVPELLESVRENDVKFIRLVFCDIFGVQKNIAILAGQLPRAFESGISFDSLAVRGLCGDVCTDLLLVPDCSTVSILPWRPSHEQVMRMFCDIRYPDGRAFEADSRAILRAAVDRCADMGFICNIGTECEFYLFRTDADGNPTREPLDRAGYGDIAPLDKGEDIRRAICLTLEEMDLLPESSHHEQGPGQNEIDFRYSDALSAADNFLTFKTVVKSIAMQNGLYASFMPKPLRDRSGNGLHINLSLSQGGKNLFQNGEAHNANAESFIAGILDRAAEITAFLNPTTNSYHRLGKFEAPRYLTWSRQNRSQLIRIPASTGEANRMELRSSDPSCNPYLAFALLIHAGLDGVAEKKKLVPPCNRNLFEEAAPDVDALPATLDEALDRAQQSEFVARVLPERLRAGYFAQKREECAACRAAADPHAYELEHFFRVI